MKLSAEQHHLLDKAVRRNANPIEIAFCTLVSTLAFIWVYWCMSSSLRFDYRLVAVILGPVLVGIVGVPLLLAAIQRIRDPLKTRRNLFVNLAVVWWMALIAGTVFGDRCYWNSTLKAYSYDELVSYINLDPWNDHGQSYMDSGWVYFKENTHIVRNLFTRFHNGENYCVAPIVRGPIRPQAGGAALSASTGTDALPIINGYTVPRSGTYDWWAVGMNCCPGDPKVEANATFNCGDAPDPIARAGMRLLDDSERPYYLLAVQEWSASTGLPVKHPLFFEWVRDPLFKAEALKGEVSSSLVNAVWYFLLISFIVSFMLHMWMHRNKMY